MEVLSLSKFFFDSGKILIDPGVLPVDDLAGIIYNSNADVEIILEKRKKNLSVAKQYAKYLGQDSVSFYTNLKLSEKERKTELSEATLSIWFEVINDHQTFFLYDRTYTGLMSSQLKATMILSKIEVLLSFIKKKNPAAIFFMATPHNIDTWLFAKVAEHINVDIFYFQSSILPWRSHLYNGVTRMPKLVKFEDFVDERNDAECVDDYIASKRKGVSDALPKYEKDRLIKNKGKVYSFSNDLKAWWKRPHFVLNKLLCYKNYCRVSSKDFLHHNQSRYVVFFLHYQPERTTLPEGYGFAQQLLAIRALEAALPEGFTLVVKEHPSTFTNQCSWKERLPSWYDKVLSDKTILSSMEIDAYELIDKSYCVASITGTVVSEAVFRGKPGIVFGAGPNVVAKSKMLHVYSDLTKLKSFLKNVVIDEWFSDVEKEVDLMLDNISLCSVSGLSSSTKFDEWKKIGNHVYRLSSITNYYKIIFGCRASGGLSGLENRKS